MKTVPLNSDSGYYLTLVAVHGRCQCPPDFCLAEVPGCPMCSVLDGEWLCPADPESDYPDPDQVAIEGSPAADGAR